MKLSAIFTALLSLLVPAAVAQTVPNPNGLWEFSSSASIGQATLGSNLTIVGAAPAHSATLGDGTKTLNGAITTVGGTANRLIMQNSAGANGGGSFTNEYTLLFDVFTPTAARGSWRSLFQTNTSNANDADYFIRNNNDTLGITSPLGYSTNPIPETVWTRLVLVFDVNATGIASTARAYINGTLFHTHNFSGGRDGTYGLDTTLLLFADNNAENAALNIGAVGFWGRTLSALEVTALGSAGDPIVGATLPNSPPVISQGETFSMPHATLNGAAVTATLNVTDADNNPITWTVSTPAANGSASIISGSDTQCTISYTPAPGFSGLDTFQIRAADAGAADTIQVSVLVRDPNAPLWPAPVGLWEFDFPVEPTVATIGTNLITQGSGFSAATGAFTNDGAQQVGIGSFYRVTNPVGANGGGALSNRYTLLWDVFIPTNAAGQWKTLLQSTLANNDDGDLFINTNGTLGTVGGLGGYTTNSVSAGTWNRVVLKVVNGQTNGTSLWVNGSKWLTTTTTGGVDGRYGLGSQFLIFADEDGEDGILNVSNFAIWNSAISDGEITSLAGATGRLTSLPQPSPNTPPVITEGASVALPAEMNRNAQVVLNVTDADGDPINWTVSTPAASGIALVTSSSSTQATITYTPTLNYTGADTFTIRAADSRANDTIVVNVIVLNGAPVIAEGDTYNLSALRDGGPRTVSFGATDPNGNALTWSVSTPAINGAAQITGNNNTEGVTSYTPDAGYSGVDTFSVRVSDGVLADTIIVNVLVADPASNPKLTVISAQSTATPPAGVYSHPRGTTLTNSVNSAIGATTRHLVSGWTMTGDGPATGTASTMNMILTRDSVLTWLFRTEHRVETTVGGSGTINVSSGWFEAGKPLQITATPAAGHHFSGWTGDTAGCQIGGRTLVVPLDRSRSTITANFTSNQNFSIIALPDTQNYTSISAPTDLYTRQTQWILDNEETMNIKFVTHLGDIVNSPGSQSQWLRATAAMNLMNNQLAYGTAPGNHDLGSGNTDYLRRFGPNPTHASSVGRWINPANNQNYSWYGGASPRGYSSYQIVGINGRDYMFLHMDHDAPDQDLAWAASVLAANPKVLTMVSTHNYLAETGGSGIYGSGTGQRGYTAQANIGTWGDRPDTNRPQEVFDAIVKPFNQVYMVICGHMFATYNLQKINNAGNIVHEVVVDYQSLPNGGNAFLRIMDFRPSENKIYNTSYSPYLGRYIDPNVNADHQGMLDLHDRAGSEFILNTDFDTRFNNTLTVVSSRGGVTPAAGNHEIEDGTPVAISAALQVVGQTRYRPTGWNLTGGQTASGSGSTAVLTQNGDATLTWNYATEHQLVTSTVGSGIVSTNGGWYEAGAAVSIQAQPDAGQSFLQWSGDISGCTITGATISVPMNRPRGPITAEFSSPVPSYTVEIVSTFPGAIPAAATYTYDQGSTVTFTAADIAGDDTRRVCTGYTATGAINQSGPGKSVTLTINANIVIAWNWKTQYLVTTATTGSGTVSGAGWYDENSALTLTATAQPGFALAGWTGDTGLGSPSGNDFNIASLTRPVAPLTAAFTAGIHTLTVVSPQGTTTPAPGSYTYAFGITVDFSAVSMESAGSRERPISWELTGATTLSGAVPSGSFTIAGDTTLTWSFAPEVLLAITSGTEGAILPMDSSGWHPLGETVNLTATPASLFAFRQWTGDVPENSINPSLTLTMSQPRSVTADIMPLTVTGATPQWWLKAFTQVTAGDFEAARLNDSDGDGKTAEKEFVAGMSDLDPLQRFDVESILPSGDGSSLQITAPTREGRLYQLTESNDLASPFTALGIPLKGHPPRVNFTQVKVPGVAKNFHSVKVTLGNSSTRDADPSAASTAPLPGSLHRTMKLIPAGTFTQGDNTGPTPGRPAHPVQVAAFMMDQLEVTRADWEKVATWALANGYDLPVTLRYNKPPYNVPLDHPAVAVSWYDSVKWCNARSEMEGRRPVYFTDTAAAIVYRTGEIDLISAHVNWAGDGYRLPTESEWERGSRGGLEGKTFPWGDEPAELRCNTWNYQLFTGRAPEEAFPYTQWSGYFDGTQPGGMPDMANGYGLYDMAGNAWEWVWDRSSNYTADKQYDPKGPDSGTVQRIQRGGSWWNYVDQATNFQRLPFPPNGSDDYGMIGFRCVRGLHPNE